MPPTPAVAPVIAGAPIALAAVLIVCAGLMVVSLYGMGNAARSAASATLAVMSPIATSDST